MLVLLPAALVLAASILLAEVGGAPPPLEEAAARARETLKEKHGPGEAARIDRGVAQVLRYWRTEDGDAAAFRAFVEAEFVPQGEPLDAVFAPVRVRARAHGRLLPVARRGTCAAALDLDLGPLLPLDERLGAFEPAAHLSEDLFKSRLAFVALLNFPLTTLEERLARGRELVPARVGGGAPGPALLDPRARGRERGPDARPTPRRARTSPTTTSTCTTC